MASIEEAKEKIISKVVTREEAKERKRRKVVTRV
jgi:hypothetical protein